MKNAGLFVILFLGRKVFEKSTCFLLAGLTKECDCMKKLIALVLALICVLSLVGCGQPKLVPPEVDPNAPF